MEPPGSVRAWRSCQVVRSELAWSIIGWAVAALRFALGSPEGAVPLGFGVVEVAPGDDTREASDNGANEVRGGGVEFKERKRNHRGEDTGEAAGALSDAEGFALLMFGSEYG